MKAFRLHILGEELGKYLDPACIFCKRKRSEINKFVDFQGMKVLSGIRIIKICGKFRPVCDDCFPIRNDKNIKGDI
jgi:hypothetical protein